MKNNEEIYRIQNLIQLVDEGKNSLNLLSFENFNDWQKINFEFRKPENLEYFSFNGKMIHKFPFNLSPFHNLKEVYFKNCDFSSFEFLKNINNNTLQKFTFSSCRIKAIPDQIFQFKNIISLEFHNTGLRELSNTITELINLEELLISLNEIRELPEDIHLLQKLHTLECNHNNFQVVPDSLSNISNLRNLTFNNNPLKELPIWVSKKKKLRSLDLSGVKGTKIPDEFKEIVNLKYLTLSNLSLVEIPQWIRNQEDLEVLDLTNNKLEKIPDWILDLTHLCEIYLRGNNLKAYPKILDKMNLDTIEVDNI